MIGSQFIKRMVPAAFEATNRHDIEAVQENYSEDIILVYPGDVSVNRDGLEFHNSGVTIATVRRGKAVHSQDYFSDTGERLSAVWGE